MCLLMCVPVLMAKIANTLRQNEIMKRPTEQPVVDKFISGVAQPN